MLTPLFRLIGCTVILVLAVAAALKRQRDRDGPVVAPGEHIELNCAQSYVPPEDP